MPEDPRWRDEETFVRELHWRVGPGDVAVDVGCYQGSYSLPALAAGATVIAVDARAHPLGQLRARARAHGLDRGLTTEHLALYDGGPYPEGLVESIASSGRFSQDMVPDAGVRWSTLDEVAGQVSVDWVKVDVEGGELGVLSGGIQTLSAQRPRLVVEDHTPIYPWVAERGVRGGILAMLGALGYRVETIEQAPPFPNYIIGHPS